jgi:hypothetical protein
MHSRRNRHLPRSGIPFICDYRRPVKPLGEARAAALFGAVAAGND